MSETLTLTVTEAGKLLGISRNSAYEAARKGQLPVIRIGRRLLVSRSRLEALVNGNGTGVLAQAPSPTTTDNPSVGLEDYTRSSGRER